MLQMNDIKKVYRTDLVETHALEGLSLTVGDGEFVAVEGRRSVAGCRTAWFPLLPPEREKVPRSGG